MRGVPLSAGSGSGRVPISTSRYSAMSSIERAMRPSVSNEPDASLTPTQRRSPSVGLYANAPQELAGRIVDPVVCVPIASGTILSPTAAADPLDEPPGVRAGSNGLRVLPGYVF